MASIQLIEQRKINPNETYSVNASRLKNEANMSNDCTS